MPSFKTTNIEMVEMFKKSSLTHLHANPTTWSLGSKLDWFGKTKENAFHVQVKARRHMVVITLKNVLILEYQSMMTLFMIPNAQLTFEDTCEYFKFWKVENLQKLQMRLNVGLSHATSRSMELNMVFTSPIKTQDHNDVFNELLKDN
jgi:hypothetical protein